MPNKQTDNWEIEVNDLCSKVDAILNSNILSDNKQVREMFIMAIKDFTNHQIQLARKDERERIIEEIEKVKETYAYANNRAMGINGEDAIHACNIILNLIKEK